MFAASGGFLYSQLRRGGGRLRQFFSAWDSGRIGDIAGKERTTGSRRFSGLAVRTGGRWGMGVVEYQHKSNRLHSYSRTILFAFIFARALDTDGRTDGRTDRGCQG